MKNSKEILGCSQKKKFFGLITFENRDHERESYWRNRVNHGGKLRYSGNRKWRRFFFFLVLKRMILNYYAETKFGLQLWWYL